jgi:hypothetical protein
MSGTAGSISSSSPTFGIRRIATAMSMTALRRAQAHSNVFAEDRIAGRAQIMRGFAPL